MNAFFKWICMVGSAVRCKKFDFGWLELFIRGHLGPRTEWKFLFTFFAFTDAGEEQVF